MLLMSLPLDPEAGSLLIELQGFVSPSLPIIAVVLSFRDL